jgi:hypothetical protein
MSVFEIFTLPAKPIDPSSGCVSKYSKALLSVTGTLSCFKKRVKVFRKLFFNCFGRFDDSKVEA